MASSLPPPGASRPRPPLAPPSPGVGPVEALGDGDEADSVGVSIELDTLLPPPRADMAWPSVADEDRKRGWLHQRWILGVGYLLVGGAVATVSYSAWLVSAPPAWITWIAIAVVPAGLTALLALVGLRLARVLAVVTAVLYLVLAVVALVLQRSVGLPLLVCALAAVAVTVAGWGIRADPGRHAVDGGGSPVEGSPVEGDAAEGDAADLVPG